MWTDVIHDINTAYEKVENERKLQAQQLKEFKAVNEEREKALTKSKALVRNTRAQTSNWQSFCTKQ